MPTPDREAVRLRFIRDLGAFIKTSAPNDDPAKTAAVEKVEARLVSLERELRLLGAQRP